MSRTKTRAAVVMCLAALVFPACAVLDSRPVKQLAYAEAALQGATLANAETNPDTSAIFQIAKDSLARARSYYRLKNFRECRKLAVRARSLAEEAEWKALRGSAEAKEDKDSKEEKPREK